MTPVNSVHIELVECSDPLVDLAGYNFVLQPEYFAQGFSKDNRMFLRKLVAEKLAMIQRQNSSIVVDLLWFFASAWPSGQFWRNTDHLSH